MEKNSINYEQLYSKVLKNLKSVLTNEKTGYVLDRKAEGLAFLLALETGLRVSDLLKLKFKNFSYNSDIKAHTFTVVLIKSKATHTGVVSNELYKMIELFSKSLVVDHGLDIYDKSEFIFYNYSTYSLYTRQWLHKRIKILAKNLGFENCGLHGIRKASAFKVLEHTGSISLTQYHLGHTNKKTTNKFIGVTKMSELQRLAKVF